MSFFSKIFRSVGQVLKPVAAGLAAIYAPAALPLVMGAIGHPQADPAEDPGGYFPKPMNATSSNPSLALLMEQAGAGFAWGRVGRDLLDQVPVVGPLANIGIDVYQGEYDDEQLDEDEEEPET